MKAPALRDVTDYAAQITRETGIPIEVALEVEGLVYVKIPGTYYGFLARPIMADAYLMGIADCVAYLNLKKKVKP